MKAVLLLFAVSTATAQTVTLVDCACGLFCERKNDCRKCEEPRAAMPDC